MSQMHGTAIDQAPKAAVRLPMTTARRVALLFGVPLCLLFTAFTAFSLVAHVGQGSTSVSYQVPAGASRVTVTTSGGDVVLRQAAAGSGSVTGTGYYSLIRPHITHPFTAGDAFFNYHCAFAFVNCGLNATLSVPRGTAVSVSTDGGNVTASGTSGDITLSTSGGPVTASGMAGELGLTTGGGDINASAIAALQVSADTGGGNVKITFTTVPHNVQVTTGGGNITIIVPPGAGRYHITATTGGGNTRTLPDDPSSPNLITATSGGGDITIEQAPSPAPA
jgi:hypothetical protein